MGAVERGNYECLLYSDWLRSDGIVRQPLSMLTRQSPITFEAVLQDISQPLDLWRWRSDSKDQTEDVLNWNDDSVWISRDTAYDLSVQEPGVLGQQLKTIEDYNALWMACKVAYMTHIEWDEELIRNTYPEVFDMPEMPGRRLPDMGWKSDYDIDGLIGACLKAGLLVEDASMSS
ncbi:hypothetical protein BJ508DRAFT_328901 [Ascobolus immersus RN42]|uniref:Uncharacterized protein n=1 Tax=Ascobolus immersus RN42 TaxID=1160509 RepID=A0A3N4I2I0_ASCIM|nr:hypothetical protein BJ508DRAFT_328901 [Ascobolus immersus RN42]